MLADFDVERNALTVWISTQPHYNARQNLASALEILELNVRVIAEDVGGGFGSKSRPYPEEMIAAHASRVLRRPVKWIEDRFENLQATTHSRGIEVDLEIGCDAEARFTAMKAAIVVDIGAYVYTSGIATAEVAAVTHHQRLSLSQHRYRRALRRHEQDANCKRTYRGAGAGRRGHSRWMPSWICLAKELVMTGPELRRRNLVRSTDLPVPVTCGERRCSAMP